MAAVKDNRLVIIGNSHAGISALESIHKADPQRATIIINKEAGMPYSPTSLVAFIAGEIAEQKLSLRSQPFYDAMNATLLNKHRVEDLDTKNKVISFTNGVKLGYDRVLIATGSVPIVPPTDGLREEDALTVRTLEDARRIIELSKNSKKVAILGAGLIAMEVALALRKRGLDVTVIVRSRILRVYVDDDAASIIKDICQKHGIKVMEKSPITSVEKMKKATRINLPSGDKVDADFAIVATGVRPNVDFMADSGIKLMDGILVNERMQTNDPSVYASGDVAQGKGYFGEDNVLVPTVTNAVYQGKVAGSNMAGRNEVFPGSLPVNIFNFFGNIVYSIGEPLSENEDKGLEVVKAVDKPNKSLKKLVLKDGKLVGCTMINQPVEAGLCRAMIVKGWETDEVIKHFNNDLASAFRRTLIKNSGVEMKRQRERKSL